MQLDLARYEMNSQLLLLTLRVIAQFQGLSEAILRVVYLPAGWNVLIFRDTATQQPPYLIHRSHMQALIWMTGPIITSQFM